jgi:hypothetical protein
MTRCLGPVTTLLKPSDLTAIISAASKFADSLQDAKCPDKVWAEIKGKEKSFTTVVCAATEAKAEEPLKKIWDDFALHRACDNIGDPLGVSCVGSCKEKGENCLETAQGAAVKCDRNPPGDAACRDKDFPLSYKCTTTAVNCNCICR